ncbi:MAG: hypothetical protein ABJE95_02515 [Byssovorax sp.]
MSWAARSSMDRQAGSRWSPPSGSVSRRTHGMSALPQIGPPILALSTAATLGYVLIRYSIFDFSPIVPILALGAFGMCWLGVPTFVSSLAAWAAATSVAAGSSLFRGFRLDVSPRGFVLWRTWAGLPYRRVRLPLTAHVEVAGGYGDPSDRVVVEIKMHAEEIVLGSTSTGDDLCRVIRLEQDHWRQSMSHDWVYTSASPSHLARARSDRSFALGLAEGASSTLGEGHGATRVDIPHQLAYDIWYVLSPDKLRTDPGGNDPGDDLIGQAMVGFHVLNHEIDTGYGRAHYLEPARVQQASALLEGVSPNEFELGANALANTGYARLADHGSALTYYA